MDHKQSGTELGRNCHLLSHLHGEITSFEGRAHRLLLVLHHLREKSQSAPAGLTRETRDPITGLLSSRVFLAKTQALLSQSRVKNLNCGVIVMSLDDLNQLRENHGHSTEDDVLKRVGMLLKQFESPNCIVGKLGDEELAMTAQGKDAEILWKAEQIRRGVERMHGPVKGPNGSLVDGVEWKCTMSAGMASARNAEFDAHRLIGSAREALMYSKRRGRNRVGAV